MSSLSLSNVDGALLAKHDNYTVMFFISGTKPVSQLLNIAVQQQTNIVYLHRYASIV